MKCSIRIHDHEILSESTIWIHIWIHDYDEFREVLCQNSYYELTFIFFLMAYAPDICLQEFCFVEAYFFTLFCLLALSRPRTLLHDKFRSKTSMWDDQPFTLWCWAPPSLCVWYPLVNAWWTSVACAPYICLLEFCFVDADFLLLFCLCTLRRCSKTSMWDDQPFTLWCWAPPSLCQGSTTILLWLPVALPPTCSPLHSMAQAVHHVHLWVSWSHGVWQVKMHLQDALIYGACSERPWNLVPDWSNRMGTHLRGK